jgi:hypothetical protein
MQVYPNRVATVTSTTACNINNTIDGSSSFNLVSTSCPNGRWYWTENYSNSSSPYTGAGVTALPFTITGTSQASINISAYTPLTAGGGSGGRITMFIELINKGSSSLAITSSGVSGLFSGASSYYASF